MKYMIMMFGDATTMMEVRSTEWITEMMEFMHTLNKDLIDAGELVEARGLAFPSEAKTVRLSGGVPVVTDGPYAEAKESLAGYWILDVETEERVIEVAGRVVAYAEIVEIRQVPDAPPEI